MVYKSEIGLELVILLGMEFVVVSILCIAVKAWIGLVILALSALFVTYVFKAISYVISGNELTVKNGLFGTTRINIHEISEIIKTSSLASAPAASLDRIEVKYGQNRKVIISPQEREKFVSQLKFINPGIEVKI